MRVSGWGGRRSDWREKVDKGAREGSEPVNHMMGLVNSQIFTCQHAFLGNSSLYTLDVNNFLE